MSGIPEEKPKTITISDLFPELSDSQLTEVRETLDGYCTLVLRIFERLERERRQAFDGGLPGS